MTIGILAVQGAFLEHEKMLERSGTDYIELRQEADLSHHIDGLILPGGESTVQGKLLKELGMFDILKKQIEAGLPVLATCAGLILLAENLTNDDNHYFQSLPVTVRRNAYGRQLGSFHINAEYGNWGEIPMTFIRAPLIESAGPEVEVLAYVRGKPAAVRYNNQIALAFHPELDGDICIYRQFLDLCKKRS